jgi:hypothetical protein
MERMRYMAKNTKRGYSDALGGYGVPAQVEITGEAEIKSAAPAGPRKGVSFTAFTARPRNLLILAVIAVAVVLVILWATGVLGSPYSGDISSIQKETQITNGANVTNYLPILAEDVDWSSLDDKKRANIAKYAVGEALKEAEKDQAGIFNIMGQTYDRSQSVFLYTEDGQIQIRVDGAVTESVPIK